MISDEQINQLISRYDELQAKLAAASGTDREAFARMSKEFSDISPIVAEVSELRRLRHELADLDAIIVDPQSESDMRALAQDERDACRQRLPALEHKVQLLLMPKDEADERNAILEVRAGTGGEEAALFGADLFRMYQRYAERRGWTFEIMHTAETGRGGYKEAIASISGRGVFARLKFESGVHRVQRVPETEASGRIHTSAATVAVLPEAEEVDVELDDKDLRIDVFRSSGPGGQSVNTTDSAVRITHLPTGIVVQQQDEKSQHKNRAKALKVLRARLYDRERMARQAERASQRRDQIGTGDRSERVRTYNFPQNRVTEHRVNLTLHKLTQVLEGEALDEIIEPLIAEDQAQRMAEYGAEG